MGLWQWFKEKTSGGDARLGQWRRQWRDACAAPDADAAASLESALDGLGLPEEEIEIEREMLAGLRELTTLHHSVTSNGLPTIETGHRVVAADHCHFSAPASMPDDPAQPSGRLILTSARAIFVGGARSTTIAWHAVADVVQQERDVVLVKHDRETFHRYRCNVYGDALSAAFLARTLSARHRRPPRT
jgi:hypothetical protein